MGNQCRVCPPFPPPRVLGWRLTAENVAEALRIVRCYGIDRRSGSKNCGTAYIMAATAELQRETRGGLIHLAEALLSNRHSLSNTVYAGKEETPPFKRSCQRRRRQRAESETSYDFCAVAEPCRHAAQNRCPVVARLPATVPYLARNVPLGSSGQAGAMTAFF